MDEELDQAPYRALVHYRVVERERGERDRPIAPYFGGKHGALLDRMAAGEDLGHRVDHVGRSDVGHETEPALVDADQGHAMRRQMPRGVEHASVASLDHGQIGARADFIVIRDGKTGDAAVLRGLLLHQHVASLLAQVVTHRRERGRDLGGVVAAYQGDRLESGHTAIKS